MSISIADRDDRHREQERHCFFYTKKKKKKKKKKSSSEWKNPAGWNGNTYNCLGYLP